MPVKYDELKESVNTFESMMRETYGESKFKRALQILEDAGRCKIDIYSEKGEKLIVKRLSNEVFLK